MPRKSEIYAQALALQNERDTLQARVAELEAELCKEQQAHRTHQLAQGIVERRLAVLEKENLRLQAEAEGIRQGIEEFKRRCKS